MSNRDTVCLLERGLSVTDTPAFAHKMAHQLLIDLTKAEFGNPVETEAHLGPYPVFQFTDRKDKRKPEHDAVKAAWEAVASNTSPSVSKPIHASLKFDIPYTTTPSLIRPLLIMLNLDELRVESLLDFTFRDFGRPAGIQSETSSLPMAEFNSALTLRELGVRPSSIVHLYWSSRGDGVQFGNSGSTVIGTGDDTRVNSAVAMSSTTSTLLNLCWAIISLPHAILTSNFVRQQLNS